MTCSSPRATGHHDDAARLWASVFLHDLARTHDGRCSVHGANAWKRFEVEDWLRKRLDAVGIGNDEHPMIATAVTMHSKPGELDPTHPHWRLTALLKDADGLDRVRLGDLDVRYLRLPESRTMVAFAEELYERTDRGEIPTGATHFEQVLAIAGELDLRYA